MTYSDMVTCVKSIVNDETVTDDVVGAYIDLALNKACSRLYPYDETKQSVPERYHPLVCELAARYIFRRGAEGEISHNENGINRSYASANDEDILSRINPFIKVG